MRPLPLRYGGRLTPQLLDSACFFSPYIQLYSVGKKINAYFVTDGAVFVSVRLRVEIVPTLLEALQ